MRNIFLGVFLFLLSNHAFAELEGVTCFGTANEVTDKGIMIPGTASHLRKFIVTSEQMSNESSFGNARLKVSLRRVCTTGGPCTEAYDLNSELTIGTSISGTSDVISFSKGKKFFRRQHLRLKVDNYSVSVNCDLME